MNLERKLDKKPRSLRIWIRIRSRICKFRMIPNPSSTYYFSCIKTHVFVCLCCVLGHSWGSFYWWRLPGHENGQRTRSFRQLLCWHWLQNRSAKRAHVLPPIPGANYTIYTIIWFGHIKSYFMYNLYFKRCLLVIPAEDTCSYCHFVFVSVSEWCVSGDVRQRPCSSQYWQNRSQVSEDI